MSEVIPACLLRLQHAVQALALPADEQLRLFPDFVCKVDELALDFDHRYRCVRPYKEEFTERQISLLDKIDNELDEMSGAVNAIFWTEAALREGEEVASGKPVPPGNGVLGSGCLNGLCAIPDPNVNPVWLDSTVWATAPMAADTTGTKTARPQYIIE